MKESIVRLTVSYFDWHNLALSYVDNLDGSTALGKVTLKMFLNIRNFTALSDISHIMF